MRWPDRARRFLYLVALLSLLICVVGQLGGEIFANENLVNLLREIFRF